MHEHGCVSVSVRLVEALLSLTPTLTNSHTHSTTVAHPSYLITCGYVCVCVRVMCVCM